MLSVSPIFIEVVGIERTYTLHILLFRWRHGAILEEPLEEVKAENEPQIKSDL